jgi:hypothetical protein
LLLAAAACANAGPPASDTTPGDQQVTELVVPLACVPSAQMPVEGRASPYDSARVTIGDRVAQICYGRPSARGRTVFGELVPYGELWRAGANEPTILHLPFNAEIAGLSVPAGSYSLYTVPQQTGDWTLIINRSTSQWGHPGSYTAEIQAQELGRAQIRTERLNQHVETFTISALSTGSNGADILLDWERMRARIPIRVVS